MFDFSQIRLETQQTDFHTKVCEIANGIAHRYAPQTLILIEVDSWFGSKWLGFSGKRLGALGVWTEPLSIPPFVPARIVSQRRFISPDYAETNAGPALHRIVPSSVAIGRKLAAIEPNAAVLWYSGDVTENRRSSLMAYLPTQDSYFHWYASWQKQDEWKLEETVNISRPELTSLSDSFR